MKFNLHDITLFARYIFVPIFKQIVLTRTHSLAEILCPPLISEHLKSEMFPLEDETPESVYLFLLIQ